MSSRRRKKKTRSQQHAATSATDSVAGFDYGCVPHALGVGTNRFPQHLHDAKVVGVAYGFSYSEALGRAIPSVSLVARNAEPLARAFEEFNTWSASSDGDALEVTFVFRADGTYLLALGPEYSRLRRRTLGYDRVSRVLLTSLTWVKPIDSTNRMLRQLKQYAVSFPAPFLFDAACLSPLLLPTPQSVEDFTPVDGLKPLLKFRVAFVEEADAANNVAASVALKLAVSPHGSTHESKPELLTAEDIGSTRERMLRTHFPVTLERMKRSSWFNSVRSTFMKDYGLEAWQLEQAICNLTLGLHSPGGTHLPNRGDGSTRHRVLEALRSRYEEADGTPFQEFTVDDLTRQVIADVSFLLRQQRHRERVLDLETAQRVIGRAHLLKAPSAATNEH